MPLHALVNDKLPGEDQWIQRGLALSEMADELGGFQSFFNVDEGLGIEDPYMRAATACMLSNCRDWQIKCFGNRASNGRIEVNESVRSGMLGGFADNIFSVIRAAFPTNAINDLVSVQPTTKRTATILYWNWIFGSTKGNISKGQRMFDAQRGVPYVSGTAINVDYSSETVTAESQGVGDGATAALSGTLTWVNNGIRPATVRISATHSTAGAVVFADNGNGSLVQVSGTALTISASSVNYVSGAWSITVSAGNFTSAAVSATYRYDSEGGNSPRVSVQTTLATVETTRRALEMEYSQEAMFDAMAEFGTPLESNLLTGAAEWVNMEIAAELIRYMWNVAPVATSFAATVPSGISMEQHFRSIVYQITIASNTILQNTQKGNGNWLIVDTNAANIIESLPRDLYTPSETKPSNVMGLHFIGTLKGLRVYKWIHLANESGAVAGGNMLMGWKGNDFYDAGLVYSPYQLLYTTETLTRANFVSEKGLASRYAVKMVNSAFYVRISIT